VFRLGDALTAWALNATPSVGVVVAAVGYASAVRAVVRGPRGASWPRLRTAAFGGGLLVVLVATCGPPDAFAEVSFTAHMVQHLLLQLVAAPLLVLGMPVTLLLRADTRWLPRRRLGRALRSRAVRLSCLPAVTFAAFAAVLVGSHLPAVYDLTLRNETVHQCEHALYLATACLFWWTAIGLDPAPGRPAHPTRLLYQLLIMPVMAFLGVAIAGANRVLYPYYEDNPPPWGVGALRDQQTAGTLMWISGMVVIPPLLVLVLLRWLDQEERDANRAALRSSMVPVRSSPP
jgi:putative copper resistance protein D